MEVTNRFKGLDLVDRVPEELWTEIQNIVQNVLIKAIPRKKKCKKAKWLSEEALQIKIVSHRAIVNLMHITLKNNGKSNTVM